jgi:3-deoxy-D-arabino-heptulosonate 7-phosphate (DAHP) synthase
MVKSMSLSSIAAGVARLIIELHPEPVKTFSDRPQSLNLEKNFSTLLKSQTLRQID